MPARSNAALASAMSVTSLDSKTVTKSWSSSSAFNLVHLAPTRFDQVVIVLHDALHFLHRLAALPLTLHHPLELVHARHFHFRHKHPVPLGAEVRHDSHRRHATLGSDPVHRQ